MAYCKRPCSPRFEHLGIILSTSREPAQAFYDALHSLHSNPPPDYPIQQVEARHQILSGIIERELERTRGTDYPVSFNLSYRLLVDVLDVTEDTDVPDAAIEFKNTVHNAIISLEHTW